MYTTTDIRHPHRARAAAWLALLLGLGAVAWPREAAAEPASQDLTFRLYGYAPAAREDWSSASGLEMQWRLWGPAGLGLAFSLGFDNWQVNSEFVEEETATSYFATLIEGSTGLVPAGLSALHRTRLGDQTLLVLEAGVRYVFTSDDVTVSAGWVDSQGEGYVEDRLETDDFFLALFGLSLAAELDSGLCVQGGLGYRFDLRQPEERFLGESIGATSFGGAAVNIGMSWAF